jgi:hypothetical protein
MEAPPVTDNSADRPSSDVHIAYLSRGKFEDGKAHRAGILVVDGHGRPLEFRCTSPIRPNPVQRTLYGGSLDPYMLVELMGKSLLSNLRESYNILVVNEPGFLNLREYCDRPMLFIRRQGVDLAGEAAADQAGASVLVDSPSGRFDPVVAQAFRKYAGDATDALPTLERAADHFDPLEPFERIQRALEKVHEEKALDRQ